MSDGFRLAGLSISERFFVYGILRPLLAISALFVIVDYFASEVTLPDSLRLALYVCMAITTLLLCGTALSKKNRIWIENNEPIAFHRFNEIFEGKKFIGSDLELLHSEKLSGNEDGTITVSQLCKTKKEAFILLELMLIPSRNEVRVLDKMIMSEPEARKWLESEEEAYISAFGQPERA